MRAIIREKTQKGYNRAMLTRLPALHQILLRQIDTQAAELGLPAYLVGGGVRDILLGQPALDLDVVIEGDAPRVAAALKARHGGGLTLHPKFWTATWQPPAGPPLDLVTARRETYPTPASLPKVRPSTLADDLARRDFSINSLALRLSDSALIDLHNAQTDLKNGLIRVLHPHSFLDDPTRLYRAVRYEARYSFKIDSATLSLIPPALVLIERLSAERLRHELDLVLQEACPARSLARLAELGLLEAILGNVLDWQSSLAAQPGLTLAAPPAPEWRLAPTFRGQPLNLVLGYALWFARFQPSQIALLHERLNFPLTVLKTAQAASALLADLPALAGSKPSAWLRRLEEVPLPAIYAAYLLSPEPALKQYATEWRHVRPTTDGQTLKSLGLAPGARYAEILTRLRAAWLDGEINNQSQETQLLENLLTQKTFP
ncbi:MAG: CCA tRNA nucleotidyltransferase [Anaerolineales bacterium]|nr:CCA tRNA nucleotidyltransferase [Anaerolineales bacterium]